MADFLQVTPDDIIFRPPHGFGVDTDGIFILHKSYFVMEGVNFPRAGRCDNFSYTGVAPTYGTPYHNESVTIGGKNYSFTVDDPEIENGLVWTQFLEVPGKFCFTFTKPVRKNSDGEYVPDTSIESGMNPGALWYAKSLVELFKIMREWSFMTDDPFNLEHPMAVYSKMVFDVLDPPQSVLDEIDSLPDIYLARFLKGDENHRVRPERFPQMSANMINWFKEKMKQYPKTTLRDKLRAIEL